SDRTAGDGGARGRESARHVRAVRLERPLDLSRDAQLLLLLCLLLGFGTDALRVAPLETKRVDPAEEEPGEEEREGDEGRDGLSGDQLPVSDREVQDGEREDRARDGREREASDLEDDGATSFGVGRAQNARENPPAIQLHA